LGAWVIEAAMHAREEGGSFWAELVHAHGDTPRARGIVRSIYDKAGDIESLAKERLPIPAQTSSPRKREKNEIQFQEKWK
jgi:hypothetical protein